jgi:hypothetical protein
MVQSILPQNCSSVGNVCHNTCSVHACLTTLQNLHTQPAPIISTPNFSTPYPAKILRPLSQMLSPSTHSYSATHMRLPQSKRSRGHLQMHAAKQYTLLCGMQSTPANK